jgi:hypothetical protein
MNANQSINNPKKKERRENGTTQEETGRRGCNHWLSQLVQKRDVKKQSWEQQNREIIRTRKV